jgi:hypothetical protein
MSIGLTLGYEKKNEAGKASPAAGRKTGGLFHSRKARWTPAHFGFAMPRLLTVRICELAG